MPIRAAVETGGTLELDLSSTPDSSWGRGVEAPLSFGKRQQGRKCTLGTPEPSNAT